MPNIFISHAWEDNEISRKLAGNLRRAGATIYIYYTAIEIGSQLPDTIRDAIDSCDMLVLVWSKAAAQSRQVNLEWQYALKKKKNIVPCVIDDTMQPGNLGGFYYVNLFDYEGGYESLIHLLNFYASEKRFHHILPGENQAVGEPNSKLARFRQVPQRLSEIEVGEMIKKYDFFDVKRNQNVPGVQRQLDVRDVNGTWIVIDPAMGLNWQQIGSADMMWYDRVAGWIENLNKQGYAGFRDWRLPTLEEAMSLMINHGKNNGFYIDPVFDTTRTSIWTADRSRNGARSWVVFYNLGSCFENCFDFNNFVRAVRSGNV